LIRDLICIVAVAFVLLSPVASYAADIDPDNDIVYIGAFKLPTTDSDTAYAGFGATFYPDGNSGNGSLIIIQGDSNGSDSRSVAEFSIPSESTTPASYNTATMLRSWTNAYGINSVSIGPCF